MPKEKTVVSVCPDYIVAAAALFTWASYSRLSFGIYVMHVAVVELITKVLWPYSGSGCPDAALYILVVFAVVIVVTYLLCLAVSKVKGMNKILYIK